MPNIIFTHCTHITHTYIYNRLVSVHTDIGLFFWFPLIQTAAQSQIISNPGRPIYILTYRFYLLFVKRSVILAGSEICTFFIHSECIPCCRTIDVFLRNIVHGYRDSQHRAHCDKVCTNVSVGDCAVVSTPVVHYIISLS